MRALISACVFVLLVAAVSQAEETQKSNAGFHHESEAGLVITGGNTDTQSYNLKQLTTYGWDVNLLKFTSRFLKTDSEGVETAKSWALGLRYEREIFERFSVFAGELLESDPFAGYLQKYNSDVGGKYFFIKQETLSWLGEGGYRYTIENRRTGQVTAHYLRLYTEAERAWTKTFSTKLWIEYLPNLTDSNDYQLNSELSASAAINDVFAIKTGYLVKYRSILIAPAKENTDTQFTTALIAKF